MNKHNEIVKQTKELFDDVIYSITKTINIGTLYSFCLYSYIFFYYYSIRLCKNFRHSFCQITKQWTFPDPDHCLFYLLLFSLFIFIQIEMVANRIKRKMRDTFAIFLCGCDYVRRTPVHCFHLEKRSEREKKFV